MSMMRANMMDKREFIEQYTAFAKRALELAAKARRESLLGLSADPQKVIERDIFEYGLSFAIDGVAPEIIEEVLGNIVAQEKDEYTRLYKTIQMRAVLGIQQGYNAKILHSILNSFTELSLEDDKACETSSNDSPPLEAVKADFGDEDPEIAKAFANKTFVFEDIARLGDLTIRRILRELEPHELSVSLKAASEEVQNKVFKNLPKSVVDMLQEDMDYMGSVSAEILKEAQQKIVGIIIKLANTSEIYCCDAMCEAWAKNL